MGSPFNSPSPLFNLDYKFSYLNIFSISDLDFCIPLIETTINTKSPAIIIPANR